MRDAIKKCYFEECDHYDHAHSAFMRTPQRGAKHLSSGGVSPFKHSRQKKTHVITRRTPTVINRTHKLCHHDDNFEGLEGAANKYDHVVNTNKCH